MREPDLVGEAAGDHPSAPGGDATGHPDPRDVVVDGVPRPVTGDEVRAEAVHGLYSGGHIVEHGGAQLAGGHVTHQPLSTFQ